MRVRAPQPKTRAQRVLSALTAAGAPVAAGQLPTIELPRFGLPVMVFWDAVLAAGFTEVTGGAWPSDATLADHGEVLTRDGPDAVFRMPDGSLALVCLHNGWFQLTVAAPERAVGNATVTAFQGIYPPLFLNRGEEGLVVPFTFWMLGQFGPERRLRRVDSADWMAVKGNYSGEVRAEIDRLTSTEFVPGADGQLILWHGPPGTGKTWAIRALASAWAPWAEFNYITDPDAFFVQQASYMVDVLLHESYEVIDEPTGDLVTVNPAEKWRVLVLEDTGELLSADAKEKSGQGLSRLLNVVDGLIGQGLRVLVLVTTNDKIEELHPAVTRPGRCASTVLFGPLSAAEASEWTGEPVDHPMTLAELYALDSASGDSEDAFAEDGEPDDLLVALAADLGLPPGRTVRYDVEDLDPLTQAALDAARAPLPDFEPVVPAGMLSDAEILRMARVPVRELELGIAPTVDPALQFALSAVAESHNTSVKAIVELLADARAPQGVPATDVAVAALEALREFGNRPAAAPAAAPDVHVHLPEQPVNVTVEGARVEPHLHLAAQEPPVVNIGETTIHVPAAEAVPVQVDVHVPPAAPQPAPVVNVTAAAAPAAPAPERRVRFVENAVTGEREAVIENLHDLAE